jgi:aminoglycoside 6'-N-acetyltransferase I
MRPDDKETVQQVAALLIEGFKEHWPKAWLDMDAALEEAQESFGVERIIRVAVDERGKVLGWIGGISQYNEDLRFASLLSVRRSGNKTAWGGIE